MISCGWNATEKENVAYLTTSCRKWKEREKKEEEKIDRANNGKRKNERLPYAQVIRKKKGRVPAAR